jgi:hypothetical protein
MKHLLYGTAVAVVLGFAAPVWAQAPTTQYPSGMPSAAPPAQSAAPYAQSAPYAQQPTSSTSQAMPYGQQPAGTAPYAQQSPTQMPPSSAMAPGAGAESATEPMGREPTMGRRHASRHSRHHHVAHMNRGHRSVAARAGGRTANDSVADQLNRSELNQGAGGGMPPAGAARQAYPPSSRTR